MTYLESAEGTMITEARAYKELLAHGYDPYELAHPQGTLPNAKEFHDAVKPNAQGLYDAQAVLGFLGY